MLMIIVKKLARLASICFLSLACSLAYCKDFNFKAQHINLKLLNASQSDYDLLRGELLTLKIKLDSIDLKINLNSKFANSYSNANSKECIIIINQSSNTLLPQKDDLLFTLYHEVSHCWLGKDIFIDGIKWVRIPLSQQTILNKKIKDINEEITFKCRDNCLASSSFSKQPPLVVYHEIMADMMAVYMFKDCEKASEIASQIQNIRLNSYWKMAKNTPYQSFLAIEHLENTKFCQEPLTIKKVNALVEQGFIDYLSAQR